MTLKTRTGTRALPDASCIFWALAGGLACIFGLPNAFCHIPWLVLLFPFFLYLLALRAQTGRQAFVSGWLCGMAGGLGSLYWLVFPMHDVAALPIPLAAPAVVLLAGYLACYSGCACLGMFRLSLLFSAGYNKNGPGGLVSALAPPLLGGLAFGGFEVFCGFLFTGFPWLSLSTAFAFTPAWSQAASLVGGYMLGALYAAGACLLASALCQKRPEHLPQTPLKAAPHRLARPLALACGLGLLLCPPLYGAYRLAGADATQKTPPLRVIMVQGNVDQNEKWDAAYQEGTLELYLALSEKAASALPPQGETTEQLLVLWPETAMPFYFELHDLYAVKLENFARRHKAHLAFGTLGIRDANGHQGLYNRMYLISPKGRVSGFYDKEHLVPFGEYIPFSASLPFLDKLMQYMNFTPGDNPLALNMTARPDETPPRLGTLICYEAIFPSLAQQRASQGANVFINISNDGWFRKSSAPLQHFSHAVMRSVEQARPTLRCTNTGITAVVDAYGRIRERLEGLFTTDTLTASVAPSESLTLYHRLHPAPEGLLCALALFSLFGYSFFNRRRE